MGGGSPVVSVALAAEGGDEAFVAALAVGRSPFLGISARLLLLISAIS